MSWESPLRGLARDLRAIYEPHFCFSQVSGLMRFVDEHINALAFIEEINHDAHEGRAGRGAEEGGPDEHG